jgi:hypothetical protein
MSVSEEMIAEGVRCLDMLPLFATPKDAAVAMYLSMKAAEPLPQGNERELMKGARDIPTPRSGGGMVAPNLKSTPVGGRAPADLFRWLDGDNRKCCCRGRAMAKEHIADLERQIAAKDAQLEAMQAEIERLREALKAIRAVTLTNNSAAGKLIAIESILATQGASDDQ